MTTVEIVTTPLMLVLDELATCVCRELETTGAGPTCWCGVYPGNEVAWDFCSDCSHACGMGWVRLAGVFPYESFPVPQVDLNCRLPLAYAVEVGALRCVPVFEEDGTLPTPEELALSAMATYADMAALHRALKCCPSAQIVVEGWTPAGPDGGCVGGAWNAYIGLD